MSEKTNISKKENGNNGQKHMENHIERIHHGTFGEKAADSLSNFAGSWAFILTQGVLLFVWAGLNLSAWIYHWDPYPFIFLNLLLSIQAAFSGPIILMSQNRAAQRDRRKAEMDLATDRKAEREIEDLQRELKRLESEKIDKILSIVKNNKGL